MLIGPIIKLSLSFSLSPQMFLRAYCVPGKIFSEKKSVLPLLLFHSSNFLQTNIAKISLFYVVSVWHLGSCIVYVEFPAMTHNMNLKL